MDFLDTVHGSLLEGFYPSGWDFERIDACCAQSPADALRPREWWNKGFEPTLCGSVEDFNVMLGHEIALEIRSCRDERRELALIMPVGPMGMYRWAVYFLKAWNVSCAHVTGFNMDEWSDGEGNTLSPDSPASFKYAMSEAFYGPLGELTVPEGQRNFATRENLPTYADKIAAIRARGGKLVTVYGIGRMCHIAFWEPHFAAEFESDEEWMRQTHRLGAKLHPLTIEQNAITSFKSRTSLVPCRANTIGPALFLSSDRMIGGCDGALGRGMQWQGMSVMMTLGYGPTRWVTSSYVPTRPGRLFILSELAGPLAAECN